MNSICPSPHCRSYAEPLRAHQTAQFAGAAIKTQTAADLSFRTTDGDTVTVSTQSLQQAAYSTYDYKGRLSGQSVAVHGEHSRIETSNGFAVAVQGELDQEEWADIQKVIDAAKSASSELATGDLDGALSPFENLGELDSLQSFQASLSFSRELAALQAKSRSTQSQRPINENEEHRKVPHAQSQFQRLLEAIEQLDKYGKGDLSKHLKERLEKLSEPLSPADRDRQLAEQISSELLRRQSSI